jgi:glycosyltransferase involved in cell wall biosynthesis
MPPTVSVIVPAYNEPDFLAEALRSVAAQTQPPLEVIVVDDGSPRDLRAAAESAGLGARLHFVRQDNAGGAAARNRGIALARGDWIALLDHDDRWLPHKLERQLAAAAGHPEAGLVYCQLRQFGTGSDPGPFPDAAPSGRILAALLERTLIRTLSTVLVRRDAVPPNEWFRTDLAIANDLELYYRIAERSDLVFVPEVLVEWRRTGATASANAVRLHREVLQVLAALAARLGGSPPADLRRMLQRRILRHQLGAGSALLRSGDVAAARQCYRQALSRAPLRALGGILRTLLPRAR